MFLRSKRAAGLVSALAVISVCSFSSLASADDVMNWWRHHNSYVPALDEPVAREVRAVIEREGAFRLTKNVLGIAAYV